MNLDAFKTNGSSPPKSDYRPECRVIGCGPLTHDHDPRPDFLVADHGTIFLLQPITDRALAWVREHLPPTLPTPACPLWSSIASSLTSSRASAATASWSGARPWAPTSSSSARAPFPYWSR